MFFYEKMHDKKYKNNLKTKSQYWKKNYNYIIFHNCSALKVEAGFAALR